MRFALALFFAVLFIFVLMTDSAFASNPTHSSTKSFEDWKSEKVTSAKKQLESSKDRLVAIKQKMATAAEIKGIEAQIDQDRWSLEMAEDLTSTDYLVLYLSNQKGSEKFKEAASKLSADDTAKVLEAYLNAVATQQSDKNRVKFPRHSDQSL